MAERVPVARAGDLLEGRPIRIEAFGREIALVRDGGVVRAVDDVCPHRGGPMHQGEVEDGCLSCPLHGWSFSLTSGEMVGQPEVHLDVFVVSEADGMVFLEPPP